jgi:hypothetical protein
MIARSAALSGVAGSIHKFAVADVDSEAKFAIVSTI